MPEMNDEWESLRQAEARHAERQLILACSTSRIGRRTLQSRDRTADVVQRRALVAFALRQYARWSQERIATALQRTPRQVRNMLRKMRIIAP